MDDIYKHFKNISTYFENLSKALLYKRIVKIIQEAKEESEDNMMYDILIDAFNDAIKYRTKCELEGKTEEGWIPVSERLPEKYGNYLVTVEANDGTASIKFQMVDHYGPKWLHDEKTKKVIAWMPVPEPYKEDNNAERDA